MLFTLFCRILDWHAPGPVGFDGLSATSRCRSCGARILRDSQGSWFAVRDA